MEFFLKTDEQVFSFINHVPHNLFLDNLMLFLTEIGSGAAIWFILALGIAFFEKKKDLKSIIVFLWPFLLSQALSSILVTFTLKPLIGRIRPNFVLPQTRLLGQPLYDFSFPSGHAGSSFAAAYVLGKKKRKLRFFLYLLAALISFSRVYLGFHYPSDVIVGAVLGMMIGKVALFVDKFCGQKILMM